MTVMALAGPFYNESQRIEISSLHAKTHRIQSDMSQRFLDKVDHQDTRYVFFLRKFGSFCPPLIGRTNGANQDSLTSFYGGDDDARMAVRKPDFICAFRHACVNLFR